MSGAPEPPRRRNRRWELGLAALVLGGIALVGRGVHSSTPAPAPTSPSVSTPVVTTMPNSGPDALRNPARCPATGSCVVSTTVPDAVHAALRAFAPRVRLASATSVRIAGGGLWYRELHGVAGGLKLVVQVRRPLVATDWLSDGVDDYHGLVVVRRHVSGFVVQIAAEGPPAGLPSLADLRRLATDPRLVRLG